MHVVIGICVIPQRAQHGLNKRATFAFENTYAKGGKTRLHVLGRKTTQMDGVPRRRPGSLRDDGAYSYSLPLLS